MAARVANNPQDPQDPQSLRAFTNSDVPEIPETFDVWVLAHEYCVDDSDFFLDSDDFSILLVFITIGVPILSVVFFACALSVSTLG